MCDHCRFSGHDDTGATNKDFLGRSQKLKMKLCIETFKTYFEESHYQEIQQPFSLEVM